jgi:glycosyltransferase involved in cell wall biosynthesis
MTKADVLVFIAYYLPSYKSGGPVRSVSSLVIALGEKFSFRIVTKDRDSGDKESYEGISLDSWSKVSGAMVRYIREVSFLTVYRIMKSTEFDLLYCNSFLNYRFTIVPLLLNLFFFHKPCIVCPRGEFSDGALLIKSFKKRLYIRLFKLFGLHRKVKWQATCEGEREDIIKVLGKDANVEIAQNVSNVALYKGILSSKSEPLKLVFLSRISEMKNLLGALKALQKVRKRVIFDIYGEAITDTELVYKEACLNFIEKLPANVDVHFQGPVPHEEVVDVLTQYDLFFLPTLGENFGHAIFEALASGLPVLISSTTPWNHIEKAGAGFVVQQPHDYNAFSQSIECVGSMADEKYMSMREQALLMAQDYVKQCRGVVQMTNMLNNVLGND